VAPPIFRQQIVTLQPRQRVTVQPTVRLGRRSRRRKKKNGIFKRFKRARSRARKKRRTLPKALQILTSPITTGVLGLTLGSLLFPAAAARIGLGALRGAGRIGKGIVPASPRGKLFALATLPATAGLISTPIGRRTVGAIFNPLRGFERGQATPGFLTDVISRLRRGEGLPTVGQGLATAGAIGGAGALIAGGIAAARAIRGRRGAPGTPAPGIIPASPISTTVFAEPLAPVQQPTPDVVVPVAQAPTPTKITNTFKPNIDISFRKSKKFINQQINVK